jgi:malic enzyme
MVDKSGVLDTARADLHDNNRHLAVAPSAAKTLADVMPAADVFIGVSAANALSADLLKLMAAKPVVFALANPDPEILPADVLQAYNLTSLSFGKEYIIPKPFDKRLLARVSGAVADAARAQQAK